jgi:ParB family transcriptional regulator, chromosome partitioning protein
MIVKDVSIKKITISTNRFRTAEIEGIKSLAESLREHGILEPIGLNKDYSLIYGGYRLEAAKLLKWTKIPAVIHDLDELHAEETELIENLRRKNFTVLEEGEALSRAKELFEILHPTDRGRSPQGQFVVVGKTSTFSQKMSEETGQSERTVERKIEVVESLSEKTKDLIADLPIADNASELKRLGKLPEVEQKQVAKFLAAGKAETVKEAVKELFDDPFAPTPSKPPKKREATPTEAAQAQVKIWYDTISRWLGQTPSIDEYRAAYPSANGDKAVKAATELYECLKRWKKEIK